MTSLTSGLRNLESQWRRGDDIGAGDIGWAGVDLLVMASAVKVLRAGKAARAGPAGQYWSSGCVGQRGRFCRIARTAKVAAVAGTAYVVVRHPSLVTALRHQISRNGWAGRYGSVSS